MGLREDLEKNLAKEQAVKDAQRQEQQSEAFYKGLYETFYGRTMDSVRDRKDYFQAYYQSSLPVELSPDFREMVEEFISLCPDSAWKRFPEQIDAGKTVYNDEPCYNGDKRLFSGNYQDDDYFAKVRLSDGSIHLDRCKLHFGCGLEKKKLPGGFFTPVKERVKRWLLAHAQEELDRCTRFGAGTQDYTAFHYLSYKVSHHDGADDNIYTDLVIFRDGTVFNPLGEKGNTPLKNKEAFHQFLLKQLTDLLK